MGSESHVVLLQCRVCGLFQKEPPWGADGITPTYEHCACCGVEFGYGDSTSVAILAWRERWLDAGAAWDNPSKKPVNWELNAQLDGIPDQFR